MEEPRERPGLSTLGRVLLYCGLVVALTVIGWFIGVAHADAECTGGDCNILLILIAFWTFGAFVFSLLAIIALEFVRRRSRRPSA